jgi:hypothetical protein
MNGDGEGARYGEAWVYESIVGALPGIRVSSRLAVAIQLGVFEAGMVLAAWYYDIWTAVPAGTAAVVVAAVGSVEMLRISDLVRRVPTPSSYRRLLFGSSIEVVLAVLAFLALVTHLFVSGPRRGGALLEALFGPEPPVPVVYLTLLVLWDVCYRIGTAWWASVAALWRSLRFRFDPETARVLRRSDLEVIAFSTVQLLLLPFVLDDPVVATVIVGHVGAVWAVTGTSVLVLTARLRDVPGATASEA